MSAGLVGGVFGQALVLALGRTILHSLWEVTLVSGAAALALVALRRSSSNVRYVVACGALVVALAAPLLTLLTVEQARVASDVVSAAAIPAGDSSSARRETVSPRRPVSAAPSVEEPRENRLDATLPWLVGAWAFGVLLLSLRLLAGWWAVVRLPGCAATAPREEWRQLFERTAARLGVTRAVRMVESAAVSVPTVIGWIRPIVLLPVSALSGLSPQQIEGILAHELAHIRRHDYLVNLVQSGIETLLFYHPAVWCLSARIRREREHCCDDVAVAMVGDAIGYARALTALEAGRLRAPKLAAAANGGPLMRRISRLRQTGSPNAQPGWLLPIFVVVFVALALASATAVRAAYTSPRSTVLPSAIAVQQDSSQPGALQDAQAELERAGATLRRQLQQMDAELQRGAQLGADQQLRAAQEAVQRAIEQARRQRENMIRAFRDHERRRTAIERTELERALTRAQEAVRRQLDRMNDALVRQRASADIAREREAVRREMERMQRQLRDQIDALSRGTWRMQIPRDPLPPSEPPPPPVPPTVLPPAGAPPMPPAPPSTPGPPLVTALQAAPALPAPPAPPAPPALPAPPPPPAPPAPPSWGSGLFSWLNGSRQDEWHSAWSSNGRKVEVRAHGEITLTDDDRDIRSLAPGGYLTIAERTGLFTSVTFEARSVDGKIQRKWSGLAGDAERREWLADRLLHLVRGSGFAASARVARILKQSGVDGVLQEISRIDSSYVKRVYFQRLLDTASIDSATLARLMAQAAREMRSAYDLTAVLVGVAPRLASKDDAARVAYVQAVRSIRSDYERRRALTALIDTGSLSPSVVGQLLDGARAIVSDYDLATVLIALVRSNDVSGANRTVFLAALDTIQSDYERRRVLTALVNRGAATPAVLSVVYTGAGQMKSDHEIATLLLDSLRRLPLDATLRPMFFEAFARLTSDHEKGRLLSALAADSKIDRETLVALLQAAAQIRSSYERATLLSTIARQHPLQGPAREAYLAAARGISSRYDQDRALAALTRAEMR